MHEEARNGCGQGRVVRCLFAASPVIEWQSANGRLPEARGKGGTPDASPTCLHIHGGLQQSRAQSPQQSPLQPAPQQGHGHEGRRRGSNWPEQSR